MLDNLAGLERLKDLYCQGVSTHRMADDPLLVAVLLEEYAPGSSRRWAVYRLLSRLVRDGQLEARPGFHSARKKQPVSSPTPPAVDESPSLWDEHLERFERLIGAMSQRVASRHAAASTDYEAIIVSDFHIPDERMDLLAEVAERHAGLDLWIAGDINDFEKYGRHLQQNHDLPTLRKVLARTDATFEFLSHYHPNIYVLMGNHDLWIPRSASRALGPDFHWISQEFLIWAYEQRHGVKVMRTNIIKSNGRPVEVMHYYQLGDCLISHAENYGNRPAAGVEKTHNHFTTLNRYLGRPPFRVILQAHTHRCCYFEHPETGVHCYEIGSLCDVADYVLQQSKHGPPQNAYFFLSQKDGVTQINESRLYRF